jgi:hypothetical protein
MQRLTLGAPDDDLAEHEGLPANAVAYLREDIKLRTRLDLDDIDHTRGHDGQTTEDVVRRVKQEMRQAARRAVVGLRDDNVIGQEALRRVQYDLDLDELRSADETQPGVTAATRTEASSDDPSPPDSH